MTLANSIRRAVPVLIRHAGADEAVVGMALAIAGLTSEQAHDAIRFIPLAFGRELLRGTGVALPDTFVRVFAGQREEVRLEDEQFFRGATWLAPALARELGGEAFGVIAMQSAEVRAVNEALHAGSQPRDLVIGPPVVECAYPRRPPVPWWKIWA